MKTRRFGICLCFLLQLQMPYANPLQDTRIITFYQTQHRRNLKTEAESAPET